MKIGKALKLALKSLLALKMGEVNTSNGRLVWDSEEDLKAGDEVFVFVDGEDEPKAAPDGEYVTEDGKTIVVVEGKVSEIKDPEAEVADEPEVEAEAEVTDETEVKAEEQPIEEPAEEPIEEPEEEPETKSDEERIADLEERVNAIVSGINELINAIARLEGRIEELEGKLAKVEAPAAEPIEETEVEEGKKTRLSYLRKH